MAVDLEEKVEETCSDGRIEGFRATKEYFTGISKLFGSNMPE